MMRLGYKGESFDIQDATNNGTIGDVRELLKESGVSVWKIGRTLIGMEEMGSLLEVYESVDRLDFFAAALFLCLRKAGRKDFTWSDALAVPLSDITLIIDVREGGDADPKVSDLPTPEGPEGSPATSET
jgi:hypothetical protein